jgi:hypothetical protein
MKKINTHLLRHRIIYSLILVGIIFTNSKLIAQDKITLLNGTEIISKLNEISDTEVKYKLFDNQNGPDRVLLKKDIFSIKYENGKIEVYNSGNLNSENPNANPGINLNDNSKFDSDKSDFAKKKLKKFEGPRIGATYIDYGTVRDYLKSENKSSIITQFGWQFETRLFTADDGTSALLEFVPLIGGFDQGLFLPSISILTGIRNATDAKMSLEFAVGPNFSITRNWENKAAPSIGLVIAVGTSIKKSNINFPINLVFVPSVGEKHDGKDYETGWKLSLIFGFNSRKY